MGTRITKTIKLFSIEETLTINLDNDTDSIGLTSSFILPDTAVRFTTATMYYGAKSESITSLSATAFSDSSLITVLPSVICECDATTGQVKVNIPGKQMYSTDIHINITAECRYGVRRTTFIIIRQVSGKDGDAAISYQLMPNPPVLSFSRDENNLLSPTSAIISGNVKRIEGNETVIISTEMDGFLIYYGFEEEEELRKSIKAGSGKIALQGQRLLESTTSVIMELWRMSGNSKEALLDREIIPLNKEGKNGEDGNGIERTERFRLYTATATPPLSTDNDWIIEGNKDFPETPKFSETKHYLWEKIETYYTDSGEPAIQLFLIASSDTVLPRPQLLMQTEFDSLDSMGEWIVRKGDVVPQAFNTYNAFSAELKEEIYTRNFYLSQILYMKRSIERIKPGYWYTMSFYARDRRTVNLRSNQYEFGTQTIFLNEGTYSFEIDGHISYTAQTAGVTLRAVMTDANKNSVANAVISSIDNITVRSASFKVTTPGVYSLFFSAFKSNNVGGSDGEVVQVNWCRIIGTSPNALSVHFQSDKKDQGIDVAAGCYVDGKYIKSGHVNSEALFLLSEDETDSGGWCRHWLSFKIPEAFEVSFLYVGFILPEFLFFCEVAQLKLERGIMPTAWCPNEMDSSTECSHNPCGNWKTGTRYYYCNGQRDVVRARISAEGGETWWRMKRRTTSSGYLSLIEPYSDSDHWEKGNNLKFSIVDAMFAEEVFTDKLTVSQVRGAGGKFILDKDGNVTMKGTLYANAIYISEGGLVQQDGKTYIDLDNKDNIGNSYRIPAGEIVYIPPAKDYEDLEITILFGNESVIFNEEEGFYSPYFNIDSSTGKPIPFESNPNAFKSMTELQTLRLHAMRTYDDEVTWVVTNQRGAFFVGINPTNLPFIVFPDGKFLVD